MQYKQNADGKWVPKDEGTTVYKIVGHYTNDKGEDQGDCFICTAGRSPEEAQKILDDLLDVNNQYWLAQHIRKGKYIASTLRIIAEPWTTWWAYVNGD